MSGEAARQLYAALRRDLHLSDAELRSLDQGRAFARIDTPDDREVLAVGAIRVRASRSTLVAAFRDVSTFSRSRAILAVGLVGASPSPADFASLRLDASEVESLRECRIGRCGFKLDAASIQRFRKQVEWGTPRAHGQAETLMRAMLAQIARDYLAGGDGALGELRDHAEPVSRAAELRAILEHSPYLSEFAPSIRARLTGMSIDGRTPANEFLYWSKADLGMKPVISLTHVTMHADPANCADVVIGSKQIFASHYFDASFGLTVLIGADQPGEAYLTYVNRSRLDVFRGPFAGITRVIMRRRAWGPFEKSLHIAKARLEERQVHEDGHGSQPMGEKPTGDLRTRCEGDDEYQLQSHDVGIGRSPQ